MESIAVAEKIRDMTAGMKKNLQSILNKISSQDISSELKSMLNDKSIKIAGVIPHDPAVFKDVALMEAENDGYLISDFFGVKKFVQEKIKRLDFVDKHSVLLEI